MRIDFSKFARWSERSILFASKFFGVIVFLFVVLGTGLILRFVLSRSLFLGFLLIFLFMPALMRLFAFLFFGALASLLINGAGRRSSQDRGGSEGGSPKDDKIIDASYKIVE